MNARWLLGAVLWLGCSPIAIGVDGGGSFVFDVPDAAAAVDAGEVADAGVVIVTADAGVDAGVPPGPCAPVGQTPYCTGTQDSSWCWVAPLPLLPSAKAVWANGCTVYAGGEDGWMYERVSTGWRPMPRVAFNTINAFAAFAPDDAWAVGNQGLLMHFNGRTFEHQRHGERVDFIAAAAPSRNFVYLATVDTIFTFDGGTMREVLKPTGARFSGIATDGVNIRVAGTLSTSNSRDTIVWHFDGTRWNTSWHGSMVTLNSVTHAHGKWFAAGAMNAHGPNWGYLAGIEPQLPPQHTVQDVSEFKSLAVSSTGKIALTPRSFGGLKLFDGTRFSSVTGAPATAAFSGVSATGEDFFFGGDQLSRVTNGVFTAETQVPTLSVTSVLPVNNEVWLSGGLRSINGGPFMATASRLSLGEVVGTPPTSLRAISNSVVHRFDGIQWSPEIGGPTSVMRIVAGPNDSAWAWGPSSLWKLGRGGWQRITPQWQSWTIDDIHPTTTDEALIVGWFDGTSKLITTNGARFADVSPQPPETLRQVRGASSTDFFAVTSQGDVLRFNQGVWSPTDGGQQKRVLSIAVRGGHVLAVGRRGYVAWWTGMRFAEEPVGSGTDFDTAAIDENEGEWVGSTGGALLRKRRGISSR